MPLLEIDRFANLSDEERLDRIATLIAKAVVLFRRDERSAGRVAPVDDLKINAPVREVADFVSDETERRMLRYLGRISSATPLNFRAALGLSRQTVARKLARLRATGLVVVTGKTRLARYELAGQRGNN